MTDASLFSLEREIIHKGDHVVIYLSPEDVSILQMEEGAVLQNRLGRFRHADMIGRPYGSQLWSVDGTKHLHLLRPTPELWTRVLPHRTQILYMPDIAYILEMLDVREGSVVVESGTGSGSFSHSAARAIGATGHLYTFDFHRARAEQAQREFSAHGLAARVTAECRDVCADGFGRPGAADAVFLDLPSPWLAIPHAKAALRRDRATRIACFSPCMEQVQRTVPELIAHGFHDVEMVEIVLRPLEVEEIEIRPTMGRSTGEPLSLGQKRSLGTAMLAAKHRADIKGHTSYLYFASLAPARSADSGEVV